VAKSLGANQHQLAAIAAEHAERIGVAAPELQTYLEAFIYRFSQAEEDGLSRFKELVDEHYLL
jgi:predicted solute-binding protein